MRRIGERQKGIAAAYTNHTSGVMTPLTTAKLNDTVARLADPRQLMISLPVNATEAGIAIEKINAAFQSCLDLFKQMPEGAR